MQARIAFPLLLIAFVSVSPVPCVAAQEAPAGEQPKQQITFPNDLEKIAEQARSLLKQLGDADFDTRDQAEQQLQRLAPLVRELLLEATNDSDAEIAFRAKTILGSLPKLNYTIADALGEPIPFALVRINVVKELREPPTTVPEERRGPDVERIERIERETFSDSQGQIGVPEFERGTVAIRIDQPNFGRALIEWRMPERQTVIRFPLVERSSEAFQRAVKGVVKDTEGKSISGASISGRSVRTPGMGLIEPMYPLGETLTGDDGSFAFYLPNKPSDERGKLIPPNSNYQLTISMPGDKSNAPVGGIYNNLKPASVVFSLENRVHRFTFETIDGIQPTEQQLRSEYAVLHETVENGNRVLTKLDMDSATKGIKLAPGKYNAYVVMKGHTINLQPVEVTKTSPEELLFKLPPVVTYKGRVVHGVTGEPMAGAIVVGYSASGGGTLAQLGRDDWEALRETALDASLDSPALRKLGKIYRIDGFTRSDDGGRFEITQPRDREFYGLIALAEDFVPFTISCFYLRPKLEADQGERKQTGKPLERDFMLFPAAKVIVKPVSEKKSFGVYPWWITADKDQPDWITRFHAATKETGGDYAYNGWMTINEEQPLYVPAGLKLKFRFEPSKHDDSAAPFVMPETIEMKQGETRNIGEIQFADTLRATVRVVNKDGTPLEGLVVRSLHDDERAWSLPHNTDASGEAFFGLNPNSTGKFRVGDPRPDEQGKPAETTFEVKDEPPAKPYQIQITDEQLQSLLEQK